MNDEAIEYVLTHDQCVEVARYMYDKYLKMVNNHEFKFRHYQFDEWLEKIKTKD